MQLAEALEAGCAKLSLAIPEGPELTGSGTDEYVVGLSAGHLAVHFASLDANGQVIRTGEQLASLEETDDYALSRAVQRASGGAITGQESDWIPWVQEPPEDGDTSSGDAPPATAEGEAPAAPSRVRGLGARAAAAIADQPASDGVGDTTPADPPAEPPAEPEPVALEVGDTAAGTVSGS